MLMEWQNQQLNTALLKSNLQIQSTLHQNPTTFFTELEKKSLEFHIEGQKTPN